MDYSDKRFTMAVEAIIDRRLKEKKVKKGITVEFMTDNLVNNISKKLENRINEIVEKKVQELLADNS